MNNASTPIPNCGRCKKPIQETLDFTTILGITYHGTCFTCEHCSANIMKGFHNNNGRFYCQKCYLSFLPKCGSCKQAIGFGRCIKAMETDWHVACFVCTVCKKPFEGGRYFELRNKPYCLQDYWVLKAEQQKLEMENKGGINEKDKAKKSTAVKQK